MFDYKSGFSSPHKDSAIHVSGSTCYAHNVVDGRSRRRPHGAEPEEKRRTSMSAAVATDIVIRGEIEGNGDQIGYVVGNGMLGMRLEVHRRAVADYTKGPRK
jgi:hypothetical protein